MIVFVPSPASIPSAARPPMITAVPLPALIASAPPAVPVDSTFVTTEPVSSTTPSSPRMIAVPAPLVSVSAPVPPISTAKPPELTSSSSSPVPDLEATFVGTSVIASSVTSASSPTKNTIPPTAVVRLESDELVIASLPPRPTTTSVPFTVASFVTAIVSA